MDYRNRTPSEYIQCGLYFYFSGLSLRRSSEILSSHFIKRNHVCISGTGSKYNPRKISSQRKRKSLRIFLYTKTETVIRVGSEFIWIWWVVTLEPESKEILSKSISKERNMFFAIE